MERIDLTELEKRFQDGLHWDDMNTMDLIAELTRMYKREDLLLGCIKGIVKEAKDYVIYDKEDEMWVYDEEKSSNPGLDAMDFVIDLATTDVDAWIKEKSI